MRLNEFNIPVIFFDKVPAENSCNKVCVADSEAAIIAAEKIIHKKKKNVLAIFGNKNFSITKKRLEAFESVFIDKAKNIKINIANALSADEARNISKKYCQSKNKPDTIFCMSDEILTGVMKGIQELNLSIPNDISIIAISNGFFPKLYSPEITYVETSGYKLGKLAFSRILSYMAGNTANEELIQESVLVEGGSI